MLKILFWLFVAVDVTALAIFGLLGLAAAGPSRTNPIAALVIPFFIPAGILLGAIGLFLSGQGSGARACAVAIAALPLLFVLGSKAMVFWELRGFRDASGSIRQFRSVALREIESAIARNDAAGVTKAARVVDINTPGLSGATVLVLALRQLRHTPDQLDVLRALLAAGADPNVTRAELPLQVAIGESRTAGPEPVRLLLQAGANPNALNPWGEPAFFTAGGADIDVEILQLLLAHGADVQLRDKQGRSAVVLPATTGNWQLLALLLQRGAPWQDQSAIVGVPFRDYLESQAREGQERARSTNGLQEVMALLQARKAHPPPPR